jgi:hypothetical protein
MMPSRRPENTGKVGKKSQNRPQNANDHEQRARVHPALPSYSVVVPAPELLSINVAVGANIGMVGAFRKGAKAPGGAVVQFVFTTMD